MPGTHFHAPECTRLSDAIAQPLHDLRCPTVKSTYRFRPVSLARARYGGCAPAVRGRQIGEGRVRRQRCGVGPSKRLRPRFRVSLPVFRLELSRPLPRPFLIGRKIGEFC